MQEMSSHASYRTFSVGESSKSLPLEGSQYPRIEVGICFFVPYEMRIKAMMQRSERGQAMACDIPASLIDDVIEMLKEAKGAK